MEAREKNRAGPSPTERHGLWDNGGLVHGVWEETRLQKHTQNFPVEGVLREEQAGPVSGHRISEALGREELASLAPSPDRRGHLTLPASGGQFPTTGGPEGSATRERPQRDLEPLRMKAASEEEHL